MSKSNSTASAASDKPAKPEKPYPDYPLTAHSAGYWCKKIKGKTRYFGPWSDPDGALANYNSFLATGVNPRSSKPTTGNKPAKPRPDFPLFAHASGQWAKKIRGKLHYFGKWDDPEGALNNYLKDKDDLYAGRKPREQTEGLTVHELVNRFRAAKDALVENGELSALMNMDYKTACDIIIKEFGKPRLVDDLRPEDFAALRKKLAKKWGFHRLGKTIQCIRSVFKFADDEELGIDRPVRFGKGFKKPSKDTMRRYRNQQGEKLFSAEEIRRMIDAAIQPHKSMILLGVNAALGNEDCVRLTHSMIDLDKGTLNYPRPKTGVPRRAILWPETVASLREALEKRPQPKNPEHETLVFITRCGEPWGIGSTYGPISKETAKLLKRLGINGRTGIGHYTLRHTFRTIADEAKDQPAADYIMGHESQHMSTAYRERISDERVKAVTDYVRAWLFPPTAQK